jgi:hypothetical protein
MDMSQSKPIEFRDRLYKINPRIVLVIPCLIPFVMGNRGAPGISGIGLGGILLSQGVEDIIKCLSSSSPYYKLIQGMAESALGQIIIYSGLNYSYQENQNSAALRYFIRMFDSVFALDGLTTGLFLMVDGALYFMPNTLQRYPLLSKLLTSQYFFYSKTITDDEIWQQILHLSLIATQVFKIFGGSLITLGSVQELGKQLKIQGLYRIYDHTIEITRDTAIKIINFFLPLISGKYGRGFLGIIIAVLGTGTAIDGWRKLVINPTNISKDLFFNLQIIAGAGGIYEGLYVALSSFRENSEPHVKDLPQAIVYSALAASLFKHERGLWNHIPRLYEQPTSFKVLFSNILAISLASNGAHNLLKLILRPLGDQGQRYSRRIAKYGANIVWGGILGLVSYHYLHKTLDFYVNHPLTLKNNFLSSCTCAAALFFGYLGIDMFLGNRPNVDESTAKGGRAFAFGVIVTGVVNLYEKLFK